MKENPISKMIKEMRQLCVSQLTINFKDMKPNLSIVIILVLLCSMERVYAQENVECWGRFELTFKHHSGGNPFSDKLSATFTCNGEEKVVSGFYDGNDTYKIRFMPTMTGEWKYVTSSNIASMNKQRGKFTAKNSGKNNHGMVVVDGLYSFKYADGTRYYPVGTTAYAWTHMKESTQEKTLKALEVSGFNKVRMCVFPKNYSLVKDEPILFPFEVKKIIQDRKGNDVREWNFEKFDPSFFQHLEKRIDQLNELGIEVDLILFHPYDKGRWGFDAMSNDINIKYIKYITARLSAFRNIWWSMANEWDYVKAKTVDDWNLLTKTVVESDPYRHLCSIHGATATYYDYWRPEFTHVSVQDENPVQTVTAAALLRNIYHKPVICDEVGYEGNLPFRWGRLSAQQMTSFMLNGLMAGIYVTHGECFQEGTEPIFWAQGGSLKGESWKRIKFIRKIIEASPNPLQMADISRDLITSTGGNGYYLIYLGKEMKDYWQFNLPVKNADYKKLKEGQCFRVEIINVWEMTITEVPTVFEITEGIDYRVYDKEMRGVRLPDAPYIILRITEVN